LWHDLPCQPDKSLGVTLLRTFLSTDFFSFGSCGAQYTSSPLTFTSSTIGYRREAVEEAQRQGLRLAGNRCAVEFNGDWRLGMVVSRSQYRLSPSSCWPTSSCRWLLNAAAALRICRLDQCPLCALCFWTRVGSGACGLGKSQAVPHHGWLVRWPIVMGCQ
jgi:hypothetical protein